MGTMHITVSLLFLFLGSTSGKKQDFGIFRACTIKNQSLRLECVLVPCTRYTYFDCEINGTHPTLPFQASTTMCTHLIPGHRQLYGNVTTNYSCSLTMRGWTEEKELSVDYTITEGKGAIKECRASSGLLLHGSPASLWPVLVLPLWTVRLTVKL